MKWNKGCDRAHAPTSPKSRVRALSSSPRPQPDFAHTTRYFHPSTLINHSAHRDHGILTHLRDELVLIRRSAAAPAQPALTAVDLARPTIPVSLDDDLPRDARRESHEAAARAPVARACAPVPLRISAAFAPAVERRTYPERIRVPRLGRQRRRDAGQGEEFVSPAVRCSLRTPRLRRRVSIPTGYFGAGDAKECILVAGHTGKTGCGGSTRAR